MTSDDKNLFIFLWTIYISSLEKHLLKLLAHAIFFSLFAVLGIRLRAFGWGHGSSGREPA
jgi:hypothetical protein